MSTKMREERNLQSVLYPFIIEGLTGVLTEKFCALATAARTKMVRTASVCIVYDLE
jgi:predicted anti-sigma-YlaC factor YlaD